MDKVSPLGPFWVNDQEVDCCECNLQFSMLLRKHHCRHCGKIFCKSCCSMKRTIAKFGYFDAVLVCSSCDSHLRRTETLLHAAFTNDHNTVMRVVRYRCKASDLNGLVDVFPPLMVACRKGFVEIVKMLLDGGADPNCSVTHTNVVLHACPMTNTLTVFDTSGGKPPRCPACKNTITPSDDANKFGVQPLHATLGALVSQESQYEPNIEIVQCLIDHKAEVNARTGKGRTPIMFAAEGGYVECIVRLVKAGAELHVAEEATGNTALHLAAAAGKVDAVKELLRQSPTSIHVKNDEGMTAFQLVRLKANELSKEQLKILSGMLEPQSPIGSPNVGSIGNHWGSHKMSEKKSPSERILALGSNIDGSPNGATDAVRLGEFSPSNRTSSQHL